MTMRQIARLGIAGTLLGLLLVAPGSGDKEARSAEPAQDKPARYDRTAVLAKIDAAIAKAVDPKPRASLGKMRACAERGDKILDLRRNKLTTLPPEIGLLTHLTKLDLSENKLTKLPPEIARLTNLKELYVDGNQLTKLPPDIGRLAKLRTLYLHDNQLATLPPEIGKLTKLKSLDLNFNQLTRLPPEIGQLTELTYLVVRRNQLTKLPPEIAKLTKLTHLDLTANPVTDADLKHLNSLKALTELGVGLSLVTLEGAAALKRALPKCGIRSDF